MHSIYPDVSKQFQKQNHWKWYQLISAERFLKQMTMHPWLTNSPDIVCLYMSKLSQKHLHYNRSAMDKTVWSTKVQTWWKWLSVSFGDGQRSQLELVVHEGGTGPNYHSLLDAFFQIFKSKSNNDQKSK